MRYLYADSEAFPLDYDFLQTLRGFLVCGARCLSAVKEAARLEAELSTAAAELGRKSTALDGLAETIGASIEVAVARSAAPETAREVGAQVSEYLARAVQLSKNQADGAMRQRHAASMSQIDEHRKTIRGALERFLLDERLDILSSRFRIRLEDGAYQAFAVCVLPRGLEVSYRLAADRLEEWQTPRKVGDFVGDLELQVGMKKKLLRRDLTREIAHIEDHVIAQAELDAEHATISLKKRPDAPVESMTLAIQRTGDVIGSEIRRPSDRSSLGESIFPAVAEDVGKLKGLWRVLEEASERVLHQKLAVSTVRLDGEDVAEGETVEQLIRRYVDLYAPVVTEIARRSPSPKELSLKLEHEDGRREELYLRRDDLVDVLGGLSADQMQLFAPLDFFPEVEVDAI